ncbi:hypothetical protein AB0D78_34170 [Streptomyces avermitilis]|uniref:hypothetical protein n=1 Tax=Streptomyces avermitilis TaxID=33903 RepID=UPI0033FCB6EA
MYALIRRSRDRGLAQEFHDRLRGRVRQKMGRDPMPADKAFSALSDFPGRHSRAG